MALVVTHTKNVSIADDPTAKNKGEVLPSDWNANHTITGVPDIAIGTSAITGGTDTCILFDKAGIFGEDTNLEWDYVGLNLKVGDTASHSGNVQSTFFHAIGASSSFPSFLARLNTDSQNRMNFGLDGSNIPSFQLGPGGATAIDTAIYRGAAGIVSILQGNSIASAANNAAIYVYNTVDNVTSPTNYERGVFDFGIITSNVLTIGTQKGGTGSTRNLQFMIGGVTKLDFGISNPGGWQFATGVAVNMTFTGNVGNGGDFPGTYVRIGSDNSSSSRIAIFLDASNNPLLTFGPGGAGAIDCSVSRTGTAALAFGNGSNADTTATLTGKSFAATGDPGGTASQNTFSNANSTTIGAGTGTVKMSSANNANNTGWLKCYIGTQVAWIPCWTTNAP